MLVIYEIRKRIFLKNFCYVKCDKLNLYFTQMQLRKYTYKLMQAAYAPFFMNIDF